MLKHFLTLEWKSFFRAASFKANLLIKIFMVFGALYFMAVFLALGVGAFYIIEKAGWGDPLEIVNQFMIYYLVGDLYIRYMLQKMPITNIKPLLYLPIKKQLVVHYSLGKTLVSFFNWSHAFFFIPFSIVLLIEGYAPLGVIGWHLAMMALIFSNNFINVLLNSKDRLLYGLLGLAIVLGLAQYYGLFNITDYTAPFFHILFQQPWTALLPAATLVFLYVFSFRYFKKYMFLDAGLAGKKSTAKTEDYAWLNRFGNLGTFLKNDIKLIRRNKRSKTSVMMSFFFIFYGLLFFTGSIETYDAPVWKIFAGIFISGGFLFSFGQFVPSWDSAYYPLMMSQNIQYKEYLSSKWYLMCIATVITTILASFYIYFGWEAYLAVLVGAIYNIGVNSYLVLWGGAYIKTPIDLGSNKKAFGDKQSFNSKTLLLTLPKLILPLGVYALGHYVISPAAGYVFVALSGCIGFAFKNAVFARIEKIYKKEKYKTLAAYKQKA
ncbi:hypothetical protein HCG49_09620 [Arenibacter sp. 6A1]|uniref:DUF5687 family protein n=1 Tax=Arenibacter sp. 6A1 TaxID=2720391 RepID=UPI001444E21D|nr:DUF5687 family protein [Arenibacter sp. 6A1]NKI26820.1 hypothetical protein [Arenibacter sp. 6A1]